MLEREVRFEGRVELARTVVASPDRVVVHLNGDGAARETHDRPAPAALPQVVRNLPGADPADHREHQGAARLQQARAFVRDVGEVRDAIERAEIGVGAIVATLAVQTLQLVGSDGDRAHALGQTLPAARSRVRSIIFVDQSVAVI